VKKKKKRFPSVRRRKIGRVFFAGEKKRFRRMFLDRNVSNTRACVRTREIRLPRRPPDTYSVYGNANRTAPGVRIFSIRRYHRTLPTKRTFFCALVLISYSQRYYKLYLGLSHRPCRGEKIALKCKCTLFIARGI